MMSTEEALNCLKQSSTVTGDSVFTHLSELLRHILASRPNNAVDVLETSFLLKATRYISKESSGFLREGRDPKDVQAVASFLDLFSTKEVVEAPDDPKTKDKKPKPDAEGSEDTETVDTETETEETEAEPTNEFEAENLLADSVFMDAVGIGLGRIETHMIMLALKKLGDDPALGITTLRFFGKIFGTRRNYFVFESKVGGEGEGGQEGDEAEGTEEGGESEEGGAGAGAKAVKEEPLTFPPNVKDDVPVEEGAGPNANVYWVCNRLDEKCVRLPAVTPLQISTARKIKKFLTGDLEAEVTAVPPFPGVEKNFLRAQIARISAGTQLAPEGFFSASGGGEDDQSGAELTANEEWARPADAELGALTAWVHRQLYIRRTGRCADYEKPEPEEGQEESESAGETETETEATDDGEGTEGGDDGAATEDGEKSSPEEPEEIPEPLRTVDADADVADGVKPWSVSFSSSIAGFKNQVVCLRSLVWPGAFALATPSKFNNIYVGFAVKNSDYVPPVPPAMQKESRGEFVESSELPPEPEKEAPEGTDGEGTEGETTEGEETEEE
ncbi:radial spoke head protein 4/6 [Marchantia polymorpha subsp. ruderalis]|uniref:Uncharacterized protein n=2 Tax=Marchantia polymorpha TaxID=3197 RepID=A0AAF6AJY1_MARPO|nr:hypothetical protein MARPO_0103s0048 [Marchantia polymorpha]BBM96751.1 hypothetical protein Mp_1g00390 [Marchantia polymorpha subsp. ruderalis]|eukprot:PTQ32077.1 hypothetical protein MARPO_0103s0048 [Marchantia polymorpha]